MEKEEQTTNSSMLLGTVRHFYPFIRKLAKLRVMENQEDGDPRSRPPGLGKPNEDGDGDGSCAQ